ncbi:hypothetical protein VTI74DRAFT_2646 [Chaetomium olivicolor]
MDTETRTIAASPGLSISLSPVVPRCPNSSLARQNLRSQIKDGATRSKLLVIVSAAAYPSPSRLHNDAALRGSKDGWEPIACTGDCSDETACCQHTKEGYHLFGPLMIIVYRGIAEDSATVAESRQVRLSMTSRGKMERRTQVIS